MYFPNFINFSRSKKQVFTILLSVFLIAFSLTIYNNNINNVFATTDDTKNKDDDGNQDKFKINVNINLNNIKQENPQLFKVVAFVNGDIQTKTVDLKKNATISKNGLITTPFEFSKENDVSQIDTGDEYFVCGYLLKPDTNGEQQKNTNFNNKTILYDCNEGRLASVDKDSTTLFSTLNKFNTSVSMHQSAVNTTPQSSKEVKIILVNPIGVIKHLDNIRMTAMINGEYQIKNINVKEELKKSNNQDIMSIPFTFNTNTEIGPVQIGDFFFGCITASGYSSSENSECENRNIKQFDKSNKLPVAH